MTTQGMKWLAARQAGKKSPSTTPPPRIVMNQAGKTVVIRDGEHENEARLRIFGPNQNMSEIEYYAAYNSDDDDEPNPKWNVIEAFTTLGGRDYRRDGPDPDG